MITDRTRFDDLLAPTRRFVREVAIPREDRVEREDRVGDDLIAEMRRLGTEAGRRACSAGGRYARKGLFLAESAMS
jgi:hypothetical protein